jgi:hypothetical protein
MELTDSVKSLLIDAVKSLKGSVRRRFMARTVQELGSGGQRRAEREPGGAELLSAKAPMRGPVAFPASMRFRPGGGSARKSISHTC